jgi:hypothetical protein
LLGAWEKWEEATKRGYSLFVSEENNEEESGITKDFGYFG